jgi:hypothetical protein
MKTKLLHEEYYLLGKNAVQSVKNSNPTTLFHTVVLSFVILNTLVGEYK